MHRGIGYRQAGRGGARTTLASLLAAVLLLAFFAGSVAAHTPQVSLTCQNGLKVNLTAYNGGGTNTVGVWIDGAQVTGSPFSFGGSYSHTWTVAPATAAHTAKVQITAWDDPSGSHGWSKTFDLTIGACQKPTATPSPSDEPSPDPTPTASPSPSDEPTPSPTTEPTPSPTTEPTPSPTTEPTPSPTTEPTPSPTATPDPTATPTTTPEPEVTPTPTIRPTPTPSGTVVPATGTPRITPPPTDGIASDAGTSGPGAGLALVLVLLGGASLLMLPVTSRRARRR